MAAPGQWRGHHARRIGAGAHPGRAYPRSDPAGAIQDAPLPGLRGHRPRNCAESAAHGSARRFPAGCDPPGDRRAAGLGGAPLLPAAQAGIHHGLPYEVSRDRQRGDEDAGIVGLCADAPLPRAVVGCHGAHAERAAHAGRPWISQPARLDAWRGHGPVPIPSDHADLSALGVAGAPGRTVRRTRFVRKEHRRIPEDGLPGYQGGVRRGPGGDAAQTEVSPRQMARTASARRTFQGVCRRRLVRIPQPRRHFRPRHGGSHGDRDTGCRISGGRPARSAGPLRRPGPQPRRRDEPGSAAGLLCRAGGAAPGSAQPCARLQLVPRHRDLRWPPRAGARSGRQVPFAAHSACHTTVIFAADTVITLSCC